MVTELQAENNLLHRVLDAIRIESKSITISTIAGIVAVIAVLMAWMAVNDAKDSKIRVELQIQQIEQLSDDVATYRLQISLLTADLKAKGYEIPYKEKEKEDE